MHQCIYVYILKCDLHLFSSNPNIILINITQTDLSDKLRDLQWLVVRSSSQSVQFMVTCWDVKNHIPEEGIEWIMNLLCTCIRSRLPILFIFLAHLSWKFKWAFLITYRPSSVCPSVYLSVNFSHFHLLLQNHWANFNQTWHKVSLGEGNSSLFKWRAPPFSKGR